MADTISISLIDYATIKEYYPFYNRYSLMSLLYRKGKSPQMYHVDFDLDGTSGSLAETTKPTHEVLNFTTPQQVYLRSDDAADTSKSIDVIGQKSDGTFGQFTLTSNASDGTTAVDCGTWYFISTAIENDTWAGNVIIDDDGASTTVFFTCALGASATSGIIIIPNGYSGGVIGGNAYLTGNPTAVDDGVLFNINDDIGSLVTRNHPESSSYGKVLGAMAEQTRVALKNKKAASNAVTIHIHIMLALWE